MNQASSTHHSVSGSAGDVGRWLVDTVDTPERGGGGFSLAHGDLDFSFPARYLGIFGTPRATPETKGHYGTMERVCQIALCGVVAAQLFFV